MRPSTDRELTNEEALAFWRHCVDLEMDQAVRQPLRESLKSLAKRGTSPLVLAHQFLVQMYDGDMRKAWHLKHETVMLRSGLALGFIDPMTGAIRG